MFAIREHFATRILAATLSAAMATTGLVACGSPSGDPTPSGSAVVTTKAYDGETIFRGIFFGRGPVAALFPEIWSPASAKASQADLESSTDPTVAAARLDEYAASLCTSGCSETTRAGLRETAARLRSGEKDKLVTDTATAMTRLSGPSADALVNTILASIQSDDPTFLTRFGAELQSGNPVRVEQAIEEAAKRMTDAGSRIQREGTGGLKLDGISDNAALHPYSELDGPVLLVVVVVVAVMIFLVHQMSGGSKLEHDRLIAGVAERLAHS